MGLTDGISRRMHVLLVPAPGMDALRMRAEAAVVAAGNVISGHPADSDVLLVCGNAGPELSAVTDRVWDQMPQPKHRASLTSPTTIDTILVEARAALTSSDDTESAADPAANGGRMDLRGRGRDDPASEHEHESMLHSHESPGSSHPMEMGDHDHVPVSSHDSMGGHDHVSMGGHDHMSMSGPGGYPLAGGTDDDRDGLEMDVLHRRLGPILPAWPAGLVVDVTLAGDTIVAASAFLIDGGIHEHTEPPDPAAGFLDQAAQILTLAGWDAAAARTLRARDLVLTGDHEPARALARQLHRRLRRSAVLRWSLRGLPVTPDTDVCAVLLGRLERAAQLLQRNQPEQEHRPQPEPTIELVDISDRIKGRDVGSARLVIAGLTIATPNPAHAPAVSGGHHHG